MFRRSLLLFAILAISFPLYPQEETPAPDASEKEESNLIKTGTVVSASATSEKPAVSSPYGDQKNSSPCWVEVTVKPDAGRSVSIHDYVLTADGSEYPLRGGRIGRQQLFRRHMEAGADGRRQEFQDAFPRPFKG